MLIIFGLFFLVPEFVDAIIETKKEENSLTATLTKTQTNTISPTKISTPTLTKSPKVTVSPTKPKIMATATSASTISAIDVEYPKTIVLVEDAIHIGDQEFDQDYWEPVYGECFETEFDVNFPVTDLILELEFYGTDEENPISINGKVVAKLPSQEESSKNVNYWSEATRVELPTNRLISGSNILSICTTEVTKEEASYYGDKDDIQIKNVKLTLYGN